MKIYAAFWDGRRSDGTVRGSQSASGQTRFRLSTSIVSGRTWERMSDAAVYPPSLSRPRGLRCLHQLGAGRRWLDTDGSMSGRNRVTTVNRSHRQPVEGELGGLLRGLGYLPDHVGRHHRYQCDGQEPARTGRCVQSSGPPKAFQPEGFGIRRWAGRAGSSAIPRFYWVGAGPNTL